MEFGRFSMMLKIMKFVLPVFFGALGGYLYYDYIGCNNGCAITGNPFTSTAYGAVIGAVFIDWKNVFNSFNKLKKEDN